MARVLDPRTVRAAATAEIAVGGTIALSGLAMGVPARMSIIAGLAVGFVTTLIILGAALMANRRGTLQDVPDRDAAGGTAGYAGDTGTPTSDDTTDRG